MFRSEAVPESVLMEEALMVPDVRPSRVLRTEAVSEVSVRVMASLFSPEMPAEV